MYQEAFLREQQGFKVHPGGSVPVLGLTTAASLGGGSPSPKVLYDLRRQVQGLVASRVLCGHLCPGSAIALKLQEQIPSSPRWVFYVPQVLFRSLLCTESCTMKNQGTLAKNKGFKVQQKH